MLLKDALQLINNTKFINKLDSCNHAIFSVGCNNTYIKFYILGENSITEPARLKLSELEEEQLNYEFIRFDDFSTNYWANFASNYSLTITAMVKKL